MRRYLKVFIIFFKTSWQVFLAHRFNFIMSSVANILWTYSQVITLKFLSQKIHALGTWGFPELVLLMAFTQIYYYSSVILYNTSLDKFSQKVRDGSVDRMLTRPIDIRFFASFETTGVAQIFSVFVGAIPLLIIGFANLRVTTLFAFLPAFLVMNLGLIIMYFLNLTLAGLALIFDDVQSFKDFVVSSSGEFSRLPLDVFPKIVQSTLSFVIPIAFCTYYPLLILRGNNSFYIIVLSCLLTFIFYLISKVIWQQGLKHYSGIG